MGQVGPSVLLVVWRTCGTFEDTHMRSFWVTAFLLPSVVAAGHARAVEAAPVSAAASVGRGSVRLRVPFTVQAPRGNWHDVVYQNACEEAAVLMAMRWVEGKSLSLDEALREIKALTEFQQKTYAHFHDRSAVDTVALIRDYYGHTGVEARVGISLADLRRELRRGHLVIVPVDGRKLGNPYYRLPGPAQHMLVLTGYDAATDTFITNDPGTRRGEGYRYRARVLGRALRDYPTGYREPIPHPQTAMIVVRPRNLSQ